MTTTGGPSCCEDTRATPGASHCFWCGTALSRCHWCGEVPAECVCPELEEEAAWYCDEDNR